jgi:hypothetical protein
MYSPSIITTEPSFLPDSQINDSNHSWLPLGESLKGMPCLVKIPPIADEGLIQFTSLVEDSSLIRSSKLGAQNDGHPVVFWSKPNPQTGN